MSPWQAKAGGWALPRGVAVADDGEAAQSHRVVGTHELRALALLELDGMAEHHVTIRWARRRAVGEVGDVAAG